MKRPQVQILVLEIHPVNLLLFWMISFFIQVEALSIHRMCPLIIRGKIRIINQNEYFSWSEVILLKSRVTKLWEETSEKIPKGDWALRYRGFNLDLSTKAKQELAYHFEKLLFLKEIRKRKASTSAVHIIDCPQFRYFRRINPSANFSDYPRLPAISQINTVFDYLFRFLYTVAQLTRLLYALILGFLQRDRHQWLPAKNIPIMWDVVVSNKLVLDAECQLFPWIVDYKIIGPKDVLFLLPNGTDRKSIQGLHQSDFQAFTIPEIYRVIPANILLSCILNLLMFLIGYLVPGPKTLQTIRKASYFTSIAKLQPIIQHVGPTSFVTNISRIGNEDPITVYLNKMNVATVMYSYSGNSQLFVDRQQTCDFRTITKSNIIASKVIVWHSNHKNHIRQHPQENTQIKIIGPLMDGDETVCQLPADTLRNRLGLKRKTSHSGLKYISFFDVPAESETTRLAIGSYPYPYTEEYSTAFLRDMLQLLEEFNDLALVFKPKRGLKDTKYAYSTEYNDLVTKLENSERGLLVDEAINPWVPIAVADLCISMPFTSPTPAAMHYGIPGLFHDPTGIVVTHGHHELDAYISHNYSQLETKIRSLIFDGSQRYSDRETVWAKAHKYIGDEPGTNSSDKFREYLFGTIGQEQQK